MQITGAANRSSGRLYCFTRGALAGNHPDPGSQVPPFAKGSSVADRGDEGGRGHRADPWNGREPLGLILSGLLLDRRIHLFDAPAELIQFHLEPCQQNTKPAGQVQFRILQDAREQRLHMASAFGHGQPAFQKQFV